MVAVTRTFNQASVAESIAEANDPDRWLLALAARFSPEDMARLRDGLDWARELYGERLNPDTQTSLLIHAVASASIVADLRMDANAIIAALLFSSADIQSDAVEQIKLRFGTVVCALVEGTIKVRQLRQLAQPQRGKPEDYAQQVEAQRKMLLAMVEDIRAVLIKLAWRTQTMHSLANVPEEQRRIIARETLDLFAPLANRLGVWQIKWELEDLGFRYLHTETYKKIAKLLDERRMVREQFIGDVISKLRNELTQAGVTHVDLMGRPKHIYSIWKKMQNKKLDFTELYDIRAVRVLVDDVKDCYTVLGIVHNLWQPIPGEFDDYIAHPKGNFYRSLHTAVVGPADKAVEVQIRTFDMHEHAEFGVAAHWRYKEGGKGDARYEEKIAWLRQLLDWREDIASDFSDAFKAELFDDTIYVLTPAGRVIALPKGSTAIDFAYHLHTDLGHRCRGAKVNGAIVPLGTPLKNGQRVEILAAKVGGPSLDWLHQGYIKSHRAQQKIRHWIRQQHLDVAIEAGRSLFEKECSRAGANNISHELIAQKLGYKQIEDVFAALGQGECSLRALSMSFHASLAPIEVVDEVEDFVKTARAKQNSPGVLIEGVDKLMTMLAKCCKPVPPDAVIGFVTKGRGISIHRTDCTSLKHLANESPERLIQADWGSSIGHVFAVDIMVETLERSSMLRDLSDVMVRDKINVTAVNSQNKDGRSLMRFTIEIKDSEQLNKVFIRLKEVQGVIRVSRL